MQRLAHIIREHGLSSRVVSSHQLARLLGGTAQRRYGLVNRALRSGDLIRLQRGKYLLEPRLQPCPPHPFALAQAIAPGSFVSFESALSFHGWIPEAVPVTMSVLPGRRKKEVDHPILGLYRFYPLAMRDGSFLESVNRQTLNEQTALVAEPLRALLDIVCLRKLEPGEMRYLTESMRIDNEEFSSIDPAMWQSAKTAYRHKRMAACIALLQKEHGR